MEAFAICGIDHTTTTDDDEEHAQVIVDVAVVAADAAVDAPWERCVGETNVGLGLRRVGIAVRKAARTDAPAYVVDARIDHISRRFRPWCLAHDNTDAPQAQADVRLSDAALPRGVDRRVRSY